MEQVGGFQMKILKLQILAFTALVSFCDAEAVMNKHGMGSSRSQRDNDDDDNKPSLGLIKGLKKYVNGYQGSQSRPQNSSSRDRDEDDNRGSNIFNRNNSQDDDGGGGGGMMQAAREAISHNVGSDGIGLGSARESRGSMGKCYRHTKYILIESGCVKAGALGGGSAKYAGSELLAAGFHVVTGKSAQNAPRGSVIVYNCDNAKNVHPKLKQYGHIEVKAPDGNFYSDYKSSQPMGACGKNYKIYQKRGC